MANYFDDSFISDVIAANDIVDVISDYVQLKKSGRNYFGLCPFHNEKTPSFSVAQDKQIYHCFGCGVGGNVINFLMRRENYDFVEAVKVLADRAHLSYEMSSTGRETKSRKEKVFEINKTAARFFYDNLQGPNGGKAKQYLLSRGLSEKNIKHFGLGYSLDRFDSVLNFLLSKGYSREEILDSGLVKENDSKKIYDRFRNRVMFPIFDLRGNVIGFGGRVMDDSKPKYLNSPETVSYHKSRSLYALNFAKNAGSKRLIVVEGYMDAIALHKSGIKNAVASLGTSFTPEHAKILKRYASEIVLAYDSDAAGQNAAMRGIEILCREGLKVKILMQDHGKDPDEYINEFGPEAFLKLIDGALPYMEYIILKIKEKYNIEVLEEKVSFISELAVEFAKIHNDVELDIYVDKIANEYNVGREALLAEIRKLRNKNNKASEKKYIGEAIKSSLNTSKNKRIIHAEKMLLCLMFTDASVLGALRDKLDETYFSEKEHNLIYQLLLRYGEDLKNHLPELEEGLRSAVTEIMVTDCCFEDNVKAAGDLIRTIQLEKKRMKIQTAEDEAEINELLRGKRNV